jgi:hypothetical protein
MQNIQDKNQKNLKEQNINEKDKLGIEFKDFKKEANIDPEVKADLKGHGLKDDLVPDFNQGIK